MRDGQLKRDCTLELILYFSMLCYLSERVVVVIASGEAAREHGGGKSKRVLRFESHLEVAKLLVKDARAPCKLF